MSLGVSRSALVKGFVAFTVVSAALTAAILVWTTDQDTWRHVADFRPSVAPVILLILAARWLADGMVFTALTGHDHAKRIRPLRALSIRLQGNLISIVMPVFVGMFTMHAYLLKREKLGWGESLAVSAIRAVLPVFLFLLVIPILVMWKVGTEADTLLVRIVEVVAIPAVAVVVFVAAALANPERLKKSALRIAKGIGRIRRSTGDKIASMEARLFHEIDGFSRVFRLYFREKRGRLAVATGWLFLSFVGDTLVAVSVLWGFGFRPPLIKAFAFQYLIWPILYLTPTPASMGTFEFSQMGFFSLFMPKTLIGLAMLISRLALTYLPMAVGLALLVREFRKDRKLREMVLDKGLAETASLDEVKGI